MKVVFDWENRKGYVLEVSYLPNDKGIYVVEIIKHNELEMRDEFRNKFAVRFLFRSLIDAPWKLFDILEEAKSYADNILIENGYKILPNHMKALL